MNKFRLKDKIISLSKVAYIGSTITITVRSVETGEVVYTLTVSPRLLLKPTHSHNMLTGFELTRKFRTEIGPYVGKENEYRIEVTS
jgi:hypothetical protein